MADIITDGKGNYLTLDASGQNWVPTEAPKQGAGYLGYPAAPPEEKTKPPPTDTGNAADFADVPGGGSRPEVQPQPGSSGWRAWVDTSIQPGPNVGELVPFSVDPATGHARVALPNFVRAALTEGPQVDDQGKLTVPAATIDPDSGTLGVTPEALTAGTILSPAHTYFGAPRFVPPGTLNPRAPLSSDFTVNALSPQARAAATGTPGGPVTETGITPPNQLGPDTTAGPTPQPSAPPPPADPPIMSQADIQARARGYYNAADQAASQGAMLPDTNAAAVRKLFTDVIPSDPETARIKASQPAQQAAKNVDDTGPMSYDTAMEIDRDLTARMRGASGSDAHDLSQLQQSLRDQMDQVPDLDSLRPGRQAWMQSIKQGQMEDINAGAALKNDPAQADAYVRQRAAALLKNNNAMRYWTPEEQAQLTQVAQSGNIGMLGRLATALIKPATRVALGAAGHTVAGPLGAIVGAEVGGDIGATAASKLRSYMSPTDLDQVMRQITLGVPPPNQLGPQP